MSRTNNLQNYIEAQEVLAMLGYLARAGWKRGDQMPAGEIPFFSQDDEFCVTVRRDGWSLGQFTDSDVYVPDFGMVAQGRYLTRADGETLAELISSLYDFGLLEEVHNADSGRAMDAKPQIGGGKGL